MNPNLIRLRGTVILMQKAHLSLGLFFILFVSCRDPFVPVIPPSNLNLLVVEGFINSGKGITHIKLSRSTEVRDTTAMQPELNAKVNVEGEDHSLFALADSGSGNYYSVPLNLSHGIRYRLHINCSAGEEYVSDYTVPIVSPALDSINWTHDAAGVHIFANTHDPRNNTHYYLFSDEETWEIHSVAPSSFKYVDSVIIPRDLTERDSLYYCWRKAISHNILLASSLSLSKDEIYQFPMLSIPEGDEKISVRYSILVREYAQSAASYEFYKRLKQNSELTGSIFSSQPSQLSGNIHQLNGNKPVIGYVNVSDESDLRLFITNPQVYYWPYRSGCGIRSLALDSIAIFYPNFLVPLYGHYVQGFLIGYYSTELPCGDCRLRGTHVKPSFW